MNNNISAVFGVVLAISTALLAWCVPARATTFTFNDEYYINTLARFNTVFPGATGYSTAGIYQETHTTAPFVVTRVGSGSSVGGEYVPDTTPNLDQKLALIGFGQSLNNGQQVASVYNVGDPTNGHVLYFGYQVGGVDVPFTFNGFDLRSQFRSEIDLVLDGWRDGVLIYSAPLVIGTTFQTQTLNWEGVDLVEIASMFDPSNGFPAYGTAQIYMDNVRINDPVPSIPEPGTLVLMASGLIELEVLRRILSKV